tara:strand:+ start:368 stop:526 length:159 start_codon:yes stop_codon:yes gene_type:complete
LKARLKANPAELLKEYGLCAGGVRIEITAPGAMGGETTPESHVKLHGIVSLD